MVYSFEVDGTTCPVRTIGQTRRSNSQEERRPFPVVMLHQFTAKTYLPEKTSHYSKLPLAWVKFYYMKGNCEGTPTIYHKSRLNPADSTRGNSEQTLPQLIFIHLI